MAGIISFDGLATGIKSSETVDKIMTVEARPKLLKEAEKTKLENEATAWQNINTKLLDLREKAKSLWSSAAWNTVSAKSSDDTALKATTTAAARPGTYTFTVSKLAQNHQIATTGFASALSTVGTGTLTVGVGSNTKQLSITSSNNTLAGVAQAINEAKVGVTASVINDGTEGSGYRLLLSSDQTGAANTLTATAGAGLTLSFPTEVQAAQDAAVKFGSGAGAITVTSSTNSVSGVVEGVTLNLLSERPTTAVTLTVSRDTAGLEKSIQSFVDSYNDAMGLVSSQFLYDDKSKTGGILMGDQALVAVQSRLQGLLVSPVATGGTYRSLQAIGLKLGDDGTLSFDSAKLATAVSTDYSSVEKLFRTTGQTDNAKISFVYAGKKAVESSTAGYSVNITAAAEHAKVRANQAVASLDITAANDTLRVAVDGGASLEVKLSQKTYASADELAAEIQSKINAASGNAGQVTVANDSGTLSVTSARYGMVSKVSLADSNGLANLGFSAGQTANGIDVAGTINGEAATGSGQTLTGNAGNAKTDGVQLTVAVSADDVTAGVNATLTFRKGVAARFNEYLQDLTDPISGTIETRSAGIQESIKALQEQMDEMQTRMDAKRESLLEMFRRMETTISSLNSQGSSLSNMITSLNNQ